jgi:hypothetical protein
MTEILRRGSVSQMQTFVDELVQQAAQNGMNVNGKKTKEMVIGSIVNNSLQQLTLSGATVDRVAIFKLLGVHVSNDLKWAQHVDAISAKAASRLYFLKQLKRTGAPLSDLLCFYTTVVRPVLEYACPVWHSSLTVAQSDMLESLQRRALRIIYCSDNYAINMVLAGIDTLAIRRELLTAKFFKRNVLDSNSILNYLLPPERDPEILEKLRDCKPREPLKTRTEKFKKSFVPYCLINYQ